jgi:hypothetical protein
MRRLTKPRAVALVVLLALTTSAYDRCGGSSKLLTTTEGIDKVENKLNQAANALNALAKTNRELYTQNVINLPERKAVAEVINRSNALLDKVVDRVYLIDPNKPDTVEAGKIDVVKLLEDVRKELRSVNFGPPNLRLAAEAIISLINEAIDLTNQVRRVVKSTSPVNRTGPMEVAYARH